MEAGGMRDNGYICPECGGSYWSLLHVFGCSSGTDICVEADDCVAFDDPDDATKGRCGNKVAPSGHGLFCAEHKDIAK
jgi:hypothetical protein